MNNTPISVTNYLAETSIACEVSGYLCLDDNENNVASSGNIGGFDLNNISKEKRVVLSIPFLEGLLPPSVEAATVIRNVHINNEYYFDIHLFCDELGYWVLFIDTTQNAKQLQEEQQQRLDVDFVNDNLKTGS